jgi:hypothetical protein
MTSIEEAVAAAYSARHAEPPPEVIVVHPEKDSPLEALLCMYEMRKSAHDAADEQWDEFKSALVNALRSYEPDENVKVYDIPATRMWPAIAVSWRPGREYLPTELIKQHIPQVWKAFKERSKGYWDIRRKGKR